MSLFLNEAWAQAGKAGSPSIIENMMPFAFIIAIFYFLVIRPQQRRQKEHQAFLAQLKRGDEVLTSSGVFGRIEGLTEKFVTLEIAEGVRVRMLRTTIASPVVEESK